MADEPNGWADWLGHEMTRRRMTNMALAEAAGVDKATVGKWLTGKSPVRFHGHVRAVAEALEVDVKEAYLAAGILRKEDLDMRVVEKELDQVPAEDLVSEINRRMELLKRYEGVAVQQAGDAPANGEQASEPADELGKVRALRPEDQWQHEHDLAALRHPDAPDADLQGLDDGEE